MTRTSVQVIETNNTVQIVNEHNVVEIPQTEYVIQITSPGPQGRRGSIFHTGNGIPSDDLGVDGDFYINLDDANRTYGPKANGEWPDTPIGRFSDETKRYVHNQPTSSSTWTVAHDLGGKPSVTVVDTANNVVIGDVTYISDGTVRIQFTRPVSGYAYLT